MIKSVFTTLFLGVLFYSGHSIGDQTNELKNPLEPLLIIQIIKSGNLSNKIETPIAVRYIKIGDSTPSCTLINKKNYSNMLELISPEKGLAFGNCAKNIIGPFSFSENGKHYAVYKYVVEDPRSLFTTSYQFIQLTNNQFFPCENNEQLHEYLDNYSIKHGIKNSAIKAIDKYGCKIPIKID